MFTDKHDFPDKTIGVIMLPQKKEVGEPVDYATEVKKDEKTNPNNPGGA